jgi:hypothetical protein
VPKPLAISSSFPPLSGYQLLFCYSRDHATAIRAITAHSLDLDAPTPSSIIARLLRVDSESITVSYQLRKPASEGDSDSQGTQEDEGQLEEGEIMIRPPIEGVNQAAGRLLALAKEATQSLKWVSLRCSCLPL